MRKIFARPPFVALFVSGVVLFSVMSFIQAQDSVDVELNGAIALYGLKPLAALPARNDSLFKLGRDLFFEKKISGNKNISCSDCHHPRSLTVDALPLALGEGAQGIGGLGQGRQQKTADLLARNTPALYNLNSVPSLFWDGRVFYDEKTKFLVTPEARLNSSDSTLAPIAKRISSALSAQALFPMVTHDEMRGRPGSNEIADAKTNEEAWRLIVRQVLTDSDYLAEFQKIYPGEEITIAHFGEAIAEFERHAFAFNNTPYDRYLKGDLNALSPIQKKGMAVFFGKGKCGECHGGEHLSDFSFHNIAIPQVGPGKEKGDDTGRELVTGNPADRYSFRVPALRNVALTAPYMHDGAFKTLAQLIEHYDDVQSSIEDYLFVNNYKNYSSQISDHDHVFDSQRLATLSSKMRRNLNFEEAEEKALAEFLRTGLTDDRLAKPELAQDYGTQFRIQMKSAVPFQKIIESASKQFPLKTDQKIYDYFDIFKNGYILRELEFPVRFFSVTDSSGTTVFLREFIHKQTSADLDLTLDANFMTEKTTLLTPAQSQDFQKTIRSIYSIIYEHHNDQTQESIPMSGLAQLKTLFQGLNTSFHSLGLNGEELISDRLNIKKDRLFYAPTSSNTKTTTEWEDVIAGHKMTFKMLETVLYDEKGSLHKTYALEIETDRVPVAELKAVSQAVSTKLNQLGLFAADVGGDNYSPSRLTESVLKDIFTQ